MSRLVARVMGSPEIGLRTRTLHVVRAAEAERGRSVLDAGCGAGFTTLTLASRNPALRIVGVDVNDEQIDRARAIAAANELTNASFVPSFGAAGSNDFDVALCVDTIEYVSDPLLFLETIRDRLAPGGALLLHCRRTHRCRAPRGGRESCRSPCSQQQACPLSTHVESCERCKKGEQCIAAGARAEDPVLGMG